MAGNGSEFGFWQALGAATGTRQDLGAADFAALERRATPNDWLLCPAGVCPRARSEGEPPVFTISAERLAGKLRAAALAEPRTTELPAATGHLRFAQRSFLLRYPDVIDVLIVPRSSGASTLALWSRSAVGRSDLGVNRARLERWLAALAQ